MLNVLFFIVMLSVVILMVMAQEKEFMLPIEQRKLDTYAEATVLSCHRCLIKTFFEKNEQHLNVD
jgi:hypothetical protein